MRPDHLTADKGYSSRANRILLRRLGIAHTIPERADHRLKQWYGTGHPRR
jgi:hypothetical protein